MVAGPHLILLKYSWAPCRSKIGCARTTLYMDLILQSAGILQFTIEGLCAKYKDLFHSLLQDRQSPTSHTTLVREIILVKT